MKDRSELLIGAYFFDPCCWDDLHTKQLADAGIQFLVGVPADPKLLALCEKYDIGIIASGIFPGWWGGTGESGGTYCNQMPLEKVDEIAAGYKYHPALWGDYPIDEPNNKDFEHMGKVIARYSEKLPGQLPFINLHPYYEDVRCTQWLGAPYREYMRQYIQFIPNDYIAFDIYPFSNREVYTPTYLYGLDIVGDACRRNRRDMWVIIQTGAWKEEDILAEFQIRLQCLTALAYGTKVIMHASWSPGWWNPSTSCVDKEGNTNVTAGYTATVDAELRALSDTFMRYHNLGVVPAGNVDAATPEFAAQLHEQGRINRELYGWSTPEKAAAIQSDGALLCGCFDDGKGGEAYMAVNFTDVFSPDASAKVTLPYDADIYIRGKKTAFPFVGGTLSFELPSGDGAFIIPKK